MAKKNLTLRQLELQIYSGKYREAALTLVEMFERMDRRGYSSLLRSRTGSKIDALNIFSRMASIITFLLCDSRVNFDGELFTRLILHKRTISAIFRVTSFKNMDFIVSQAAIQPPESNGAPKGNMWKGVVAATIDSPQLNPEGVLKQLPPMERSIFWVSLLDRDYYLTETEEERRREVLSLSELVEDTTVPEVFLLRMSNVWMATSYFNDSAKHEVKKTLNKIFRNSLLKLGVREPDLPPRDVDKPKPKLAVLSEHFISQHAMFRCYGTAISTLRERFTLVLVTIDACVDDVGRKMFDEVIEFQVSTSLVDVIDMVSNVGADVIYYPSVGMQAWTTAACQFRLAPIQLMTLGHPATTMSDQMDYAVVPERCLGDPECFSETVVCLEDNAIPFAPHPDMHLAEPSEEEDTDVVKIAVPSNGNKLNPEFLACCEEIADRAKAKVEFHFYCNMPEHLTIELEQTFNAMFPNKVHMGTDYLQYMSNISKCDIQLSPFPFGNSNGYVDGLIMGLPIVSKGGREVHASIDNALGKIAGLPDYCLTSTSSEFVESVVRLVDDPPERERIGDYLSGLDLNALFFQSSQIEDFGAALDWLYRNHEKILGNPKKCWKVSDRALVS